MCQNSGNFKGAVVLPLGKTTRLFTAYQHTVELEVVKSCVVSARLTPDNKALLIDHCAVLQKLYRAIVQNVFFSSALRHP